ncbi:hypothetical protein B0H10DRAFT_536591 [Mycena sp. CBHHK59/15]|nr:hypothetical protein B0H10DRAFT_536591 [Mycena sp. CBHHK59/15]
MSGLQSAIAETHSILQTYKTESAGNSAHSLDKLSTLLMDVGLAQEATKISSYAVSIYRSMRATQPDSNFAIALHNYSHHLSASGRTDEALLEARNAVEIYSRLIDDVFDPGRAKALDTLAACLFAVGDKKEALDVSNAAIVISRNLHRRKPKDERLSADLALLLSNRASKLYALRRDREALRDAVESKETYRRLYHQCISDRYTAEYADSLRMYSGLLFDLRSVKEALDPARKAVSLWTELEAGNLDVYSPKLAEGLLGLFDILSGLELRLEAKEQILKAVGIFRRLAADAPDTFNAKYVSSLHKAAWACIDQKRHDDEALGYLDEALGICQMLEKGKITSSAAELYDDKYTCLDRLKRYGEAVQASRSSIAIREQAPESVKNTKLLTASRRDLASALFNLSVELDKKPHKAIAPAREAVNRFSVLFKQAPEDQGLQTNFVLACRSLSHLCTDLKQDEEALKYAKLAVNAGASMEENVHLKKAWTRLSYCYRNLQQWEFERWAEEQASKLGGG